MNLFNLKYFVTLAYELNFTRAAEKLFISQQALSKYIRSLESEYNTQLFVRKPKVALTRSGQIMQEAAIKILKLEHQLRNQLESENKKQIKSITLGMGPARSKTLLPDIYTAYHEYYPNINLQVIIDSTKVLDQMLDSGKIDLWLGYYRKQNEKYNYTFLFEDQICAIIPKKVMSRLFGDKDNEMAKRLSKKFEISHFVESPFMMLPKGHRIREIVDEYFNKNNIKPTYILETNDIDALIILALEGNALTFASNTYVKKYINTSLFSENAYIFFLNGCGTSQNIIISYKKEKPLSPEAKSFIDICLKMYQS